MASHFITATSSAEYFPFNYRDFSYYSSFIASFAFAKAIYCLLIVKPRVLLIAEALAVILIGTSSNLMRCLQEVIEVFIAKVVGLGD